MHLTHVSRQQRLTFDPVANWRVRGLAQTYIKTMKYGPVSKTDDEINKSCISTCAAG